MQTKPTLIPVASGKGGVGKSIFVANLSIALAAMGHDTIAVDLDLGGSNLYTYLGLPNRHKGISDFFKARHGNIQDFIVETPIPQLKYLPGDANTPFMANIGTEQRALLLNQIKALPARFIILDIGAGSVFNTLHFFGASQRGVILSTFETPSIMNFIMFLRNFLFRVITGMIHGHPEIFRTITGCITGTGAHSVRVATLLNTIKTYDPALMLRIQSYLASYRPRLVFNMLDHPKELAIVPKIDETLQKGLSLSADYLGTIFYDKHIRLLIKKRQVLLAAKPESIAAKNIRQIAKQIVEKWHLSDPMTLEDLTTYAQDVYNHQAMP